MRTYFLDTSGLLALANRRDQHRAASIRIQERLSSEGWKGLVNRWVLTEFLNSASRRGSRTLAIAVLSHITRSKNVKIIRATDSEWVRACGLYAQHADKEWSLTDCTIINMCRTRHVQHVFSGDHHFEQAGLVPMIVSRDW